MAGSQLVTADAAVCASGRPVRVFSIHVISTGGGGAVISLRNGTSAGDTAYITETGTVSKGIDFIYPVGYVFPSGCFVDVDTNTTSVLVAYESLS